MKRWLWNKVGHDSCLCCVSLTLILWPYPSCRPSIMNRCCKTQFGMTRGRGRGRGLHWWQGVAFQSGSEARTSMNLQNNLRILLYRSNPRCKWRGKIRDKEQKRNTTRAPGRDAGHYSLIQLNAEAQWVTVKVTGSYVSDSALTTCWSSCWNAAQSVAEHCTTSHSWQKQ